MDEAESKALWGDIRCIKEDIGTIKSNHEIYEVHRKEDQKRFGALEDKVKPVHDEFVFKKVLKSKAKGVSIYVGLFAAVVAAVAGAMSLMS